MYTIFLLPQINVVVQVFRCIVAYQYYNHFYSDIYFHFQLYTIWTWLPARFAVCQPELLYTSEEHGTSLMTLYSRVESYQPTLIFIKTTTDEVNFRNRWFRFHFGLWHKFLGSKVEVYSDMHVLPPIPINCFLIIIKVPIEIIVWNLNPKCNVQLFFLYSSRVMALNYKKKMDLLFVSDWMIRGMLNKI